MENTYLALDLGGTKLLIGEVSLQGEILQYKRYDTGYITQSRALEVLKASLDDYVETLGWHNGIRPQAMGLGLVGRIDNANGLWCQMDINRAEELPLAAQLSGSYGLPCFMDNDVKAATRAEQLFGVGRCYDNYIYINIGTGIAAGFIVDGHLVRGCQNNAGEVGHTQVGIKTGIQCMCGRKDCVELMASGMGFDRCARLFSKHLKTVLEIKEEEKIDVRDIYRLAEMGDELCLFLVDQAAQAIANLIMNLVRITDPDTVVLGGGIVSNGYLYPKILDKLHPHTMRFVENGVVLTSLNPDFIGLIGAAAVAINKNNIRK
jgi:Transcriptional regulator/sugar kinase